MAAEGRGGPRPGPGQEAQRFRPTRAWTAVAVVNELEGLWLLGALLGGALLATDLDPARIPPWVWLVAAVAALVWPIASLVSIRQPRLAMSEAGVAYHGFQLGLALPWTAAACLVRYGPRPDALAIRFNRPGLVKDRAWVRLPALILSGAGLGWIIASRWPG